MLQENLLDFVVENERLLSPILRCPTCSCADVKPSRLEKGRFLFTCVFCGKRFCYCLPLSCAYSPTCVACSSSKVKARRLRDFRFYYKCLNCYKEFTYCCLLSSKPKLVTLAKMSKSSNPFISKGIAFRKSSLAFRTYFPPKWLD